ncbi:MAG: hypothetical protein H6Q67_818 [Firmicutes bacterium]|nr:hypothetical protein [Bacillota bacterium]
MDEDQIAQEILDVLIRYKLSLDKASEILKDVYNTVQKIAGLPTSLKESKQ